MSFRFRTLYVSCAADEDAEKYLFTNLEILFVEVYECLTYLVSCASNIYQGLGHENIADTFFYSRWNLRFLVLW